MIKISHLYIQIFLDLSSALSLRFTNRKIKADICTLRRQSLYHIGVLWQQEDHNNITNPDGEAKTLSQYINGPSNFGKFHYKNKGVVKPCFLYNGNCHTGKTTYLYWDGSQNVSKATLYINQDFTFTRHKKSHKTQARVDQSFGFPWLRAGNSDVWYIVIITMTP